MDRDYELTLRNLARVQMESSDYAAACAYLERMAKLGKANEQDILLRVTCLREQAKTDEAEELLQQMIRLESDNPRWYREAGMLYLEDRQQPHIAQLYFTQSLRLDPSQLDLQQMLPTRPPARRSSGCRRYRGCPKPPVPTVPTPPQLPLPNP